MKKKKFTELGKCPNCGSLLQNGSYGTIPFKDDELKPGAMEEDLVVCDSCLKNFENLSPKIIGENLRSAETKWEEGDIVLAMSAVERYKDAKLKND